MKLIISLLWLLATCNGHVLARETDASKRIKAATDLAAQLIYRKDVTSLKLLFGYLHQSGAQGQVDILSIVQTYATPKEAAKVAFDYLLQAKKHEMLIMSIDELGYEYVSICGRREEKILKSFTMSSDAELAASANRCLAQIKSGQK